MNICPLYNYGDQTRNEKWTAFSWTIRASFLAQLLFSASFSFYEMYYQSIRLIHPRHRRHIHIMMSCTTICLPSSSPYLCHVHTTSYRVVEFQLNVLKILLGNSNGIRYTLCTLQSCFVQISDASYTVD